MHALGMIMSVSRSLTDPEGPNPSRHPSPPRAHPRLATAPVPDRPLRVLISGGGTGGHIHPALAIAEALQARQSDTVIEFVGARGRMEMDRVPAAGHTITGLPITGFDRRLSARNLLFPFRLLRSLWMSRRIVRRFRPDVAIGVGGASGPLSGRPPRLASQPSSRERIPGITNRLLAQHVGQVCAGFPASTGGFPPTDRRDREPLEGPSTASARPPAPSGARVTRRHFGLVEDRPVLLVLGGSLGAASMNRAVRASPSAPDRGLRSYANAAGATPTNIPHGWHTETPDLRPGFIDRMVSL